MGIEGVWGHLLERGAAFEEIDRAFAQARAGASGVVIVEGGAGEGKTALIAAIPARAGDVPWRAVDDAHLLDADELGALANGRREHDGRVLVIAFRPDEPGAVEPALDALRTAFGARRLRLGPLSPAAVAELVRRRHPAADDQLCRVVFEATAGNPLYVEELTSGDPTRAHVLPAGDRVVRRAEAIAPGAPALLRAMAILGDGERLGVSAAVAQLSDRRAQPIAHRLRRMGVLASEDPVVFAQPLVRRSIDRSMPDAERHAAHQRAGAVLSQAGRPIEAVAEHLAALTPEGSTEVASGLAAAAERSPESSEAILWLRRALQEGASEPPRAELLQRLGQVELVARDPAAIDHLREALELTAEPSVRARMGIGLAEVLAHAGRWDEMMAVMGAVELDVGADTEEVRVRFASVLAVATAHDAARVHLFDRDRDRLEEMSHGASWSAHALAALLASISAQRGEPPAYALKTAERAVADGILLSEQGGGGWAAPQLLGAFILLDETDRAMTLLTAVETASRQAGAVTGLVLAAMYRGWIFTRRGELVKAEAEFRRTLEMIPGASMPMVAATAYFAVTDMLLERPGMRDLEADAEPTEYEPAFRRTWSGAMHHWTRGRLRLANRDLAGGIEDLRAVGQIASALRVGPSLAPWRSVLALALPAERHEEALALVGEELAHARIGTLARAEGVALRALGLLTPGPKGIELLGEAAGVLEDSPARLEHARAMVELGAALRRSRRRADAREHLAHGLELAAECGAVRLAVRARGELAAATGRRSRSQLGDQLLTASELRVARLAIAGGSNREIARDLYVSLKTVETHLSHAYAKLGLAGRGARGNLRASLVVYDALRTDGAPLA